MAVATSKPSCYFSIVWSKRVGPINWPTIYARVVFTSARQKIASSNFMSRFASGDSTAELTIVIAVPSSARSTGCPTCHPTDDNGEQNRQRCRSA
jgi:hypothetical protein